MNLQLLVTLGVFAPLLGAAIVGLSGRRLGNVLSQAITTGLLFFSCVVAWIVFSQWTWGGLEPFTLTLAPFIHVGDFVSDWSIRIDALSATMLVVVTSVSSLVHLYSWGYMAEDPDKPRFFAYLSLFTFAMLALVTAADFMQLFFGWEGVGLASYLLIGFWYKKPTASAAAIKAFVVNRVGDFGFALGIFTIFWMFGTIQFAELFPMIAAKANTGWEFLGHTWSALDLAAFLLFIGAMGKSAQFFLHTWLPDAMEGPTPVSALIHAATMVTAGVYMVCLLSPIFEYAPIAGQIVALIGAVTALFAATVGLAQNDIKRVIAYSTCSQLGYMFFAAGVGAYEAAMFHLFTHAFFKALLFLGAGSVIHGMHHEQDMRKMGGLWKLLPVTYAVMTIGTIAITGLGIPEIGGFAGFYSKDAIIESAFASAASGHSPMGLFAFFVGILAAGLTAYYSWRLVFMTFHNKPVWKDEHADDHAHDDHASHAQLETHSEPVADGHDDHAHDDHHHGPLKPHESPWVMLVPLLALSVGAVAAGFIFAPYFIGHHEAEFWRTAIFSGPTNHVLHEAHEVPTWVKWSPLVMTLIGTFVAFWLYVLKEGMARRMADRGGLVHAFLYNKWYFDELYQFVFVRGAKGLGDLFWKVGDVKIIDGGGPNGFAWLSRKFAGGLSWFQSGYVYFYAFVMLLGLAGFLAFALLTWGSLILPQIPFILSVVTFLPLVGAALILLARLANKSGADNAARWIALLTTLVTLAVSVVLVAQFDASNPAYQFVERYVWFAAAQYHMGVDGISILFVLLTAFLMPICILASWKTITDRVVDYMIAFLVLETLVIGVFTSLDLFLFYIFFEGTLVPMFIIIGVWGGANRIYAAYKFFLYTLLGSVLMLLAMLWMAHTAGTTSIPALKTFAFSPQAQPLLWLAFFASFAVKMPMWPVHTWLPDAHVQAPTAGSVILAGILLKLGGYGFILFNLPMFPQASQMFAPLVFALSAIAIVYTSLVAFRQTDIKKLIAYSSVAHMGFVTMGIFAGNEQGVQGAVFQMLSHGLISGALFLCVGVVYDRMHTREISFYGGLTSRMPWFAAIFLMFTMANVGLPGTSGFIGEILTMTGIYQVSTWTALFAASGVIFSAVYALTLYRNVMFGEITNPKLKDILDIDKRELLIFTPLIIGTLWLGVQPGLVLDYTNASVHALTSAYQLAIGG